MIVLAALTAVWTLGMLALGVGDALIYLAPALLILVPLLYGRYPGDDALVRAARRGRPQRRAASRVRSAPAASSHLGPPSPRRPARRRGARRARPARTGSVTRLTQPNFEGEPVSKIIRRAALGAGLASLSLAAPAAAHITTNPSEAPSDGYATVSFQIPHGCEESPTTQLRVKIPPSVASATPAVSPNWTIKTKEGKKDPVELHGEKITSGISEVTYTAKQPLPADRLDFVYLSLKMPAGEEGESVYFPTIQKCDEGETRWIQIPAEGESEDDLEDPAPAVVLTAAQGEHGGGHTAEEKPAAEHQPASAEVDTAGAPVDDDSAPEWLTIVALVLGALGLVAGVAGLMAARRRSA